MSAKLINYVEWPAENGIIGQCCCDTAAELPAVNAFSSLGTLVATSTCRVINESATYQLNTQGVWKKKTDATSVALDLTGYYSSAETDAAIAAAISPVSAIASAALTLGNSEVIPDNTDILTLTKGKYTKVTGLNTLVHRPTGFSGGLNVIVDTPFASGTQGNRRRIMLFPLSETSLNTLVYVIIETSTAGSFGDWHMFDGGTTIPLV